MKKYIPVDPPAFYQLDSKVRKTSSRGHGTGGILQMSGVSDVEYEKNIKHDGKKKIGQKRGCRGWWPWMKLGRLDLGEG